MVEEFESKLEESRAKCLEDYKSSNAAARAKNGKIAVAERRKSRMTTMDSSSSEDENDDDEMIDEKMEKENARQNDETPDKGNNINDENKTSSKVATPLTQNIENSTRSGRITRKRKI